MSWRPGGVQAGADICGKITDGATNSFHPHAHARRSDHPHSVLCHPSSTSSRNFHLTLDPERVTSIRTDMSPLIMFIKDS